MYKLLIVDDEYVIRSGIAHSNPWNEWGFEVVGMCADGVEALEAIRRDPPDIVLSDIRMPKMDGVELMQILNQQYPEIKIVILSGYSDFEYLNMSLKNNVAEYILKPTDIEEFEQLFMKMKNRLDEDRIKKAEYRHLKQVYEEGQEYRRTKWMNMLLFGPVDHTQLTQARTELEEAYHLSFHNCLVVLFVPDECIWTDENELHSLNVRITEVCRSAWEEIDTGFDAHFILTQEETVVGIIGISAAAEWKYDQVHLLLSQLQKKISENCQVSVSVGVSEPCTRLSRLPEYYEQAKRCAKQHMFLGKETIFTYPQFIGEDSIKDSGLNSDYLHNALLAGSFEQVKAELEKFFAVFVNRSLKHYEYVDHVCQDAIFRLSRWMFTRKLDAEAILAGVRAAVGDFQNCSSLMKKQQFLERFFYDTMVELQKEKPLRLRKGSVASQLQACVDKEYATNGISLEYVAGKAGISAVYASKLFKEELGYNFSEYLLRKRMEKSGELLQDVAMKVYEVAEQVGYADVSNFIRVFRKYYNISPNEYRATLGYRDND